MAKGKASRAAVWAILVLLIVGLAGFGATNFGGGLRAVGSVGETEIDLERYGRELQQELRALTAELGRAVPLSEAQAAGIPQAVLARMVARAALEDEASVRGLSVGDATVRARILEVPSFQDAGGAFDREAYRFVLEQNGMSVAEFEARIRAETAAGLVEAAVASGLRHPPAHARALYAFARERRDATWARLTPEALEAGIPEPSEADLAAFHAANPALFTAPETRAITYASLTPEMILDTVAIDEVALREAYDARIDEFVQPERRLVERLVFATGAEAEAAMDRILAGETTFDALVAERDLTLDDVDLGDVTRESLGAAAEAVFAVDGPGVVGPAPTPIGPALFRVNAILAPREVSFEAAREELLPEVQVDRARRVIGDMIEDLDDRLAGGATLEELAEETEMALGRIDWHPGVTEGIAAYSGFREAAAAAEEGDFPEIVELDEGGLFALRLDALRPAALRPLPEVREEVRAAWEAAETARLLQEEAEALAETVRQGGDMAETGLPVGGETGLARDAFLEAAPEGTVETLFGMAPDEIRVVSDPGAAWILRLDAVVPADQDSPEAQALKRLFSEQAAQDVADDLLNATTGALADMKGVRIDQSAINAVHAQFP